MYVFVRYFALHYNLSNWIRTTNGKYANSFKVSESNAHILMIVWAYATLQYGIVKYFIPFLYFRLMIVGKGINKLDSSSFRLPINLSVKT